MILVIVGTYLLFGGAIPYFVRRLTGKKRFLYQKQRTLWLNSLSYRIQRNYRTERRIGTKVIGNYPASGTEIIKVLGDEHVKTGYPIVYLSADSLMQIAMHESIIPLERQYEICQIARELLTGDDTVSRVICRPFTGESGNYYVKKQ